MIWERKKYAVSCYVVSSEVRCHESYQWEELAASIFKEGLPLRRRQQLPPESCIRIATLNGFRCQIEDNSNNWLTTRQEQRHIGPNNNFAASSYHGSASLATTVLSENLAATAHFPLSSTHSVLRNLVRVPTAIETEVFSGPSSYPRSSQSEAYPWQQSTSFNI
jgi:hypothetical protein